MNETRDEKLAARVAAVNRANGAAHQLYADLVKIFEPLVGVKLEKVDGTLRKEFAKLLPEFPYSHALHVYRHTSNYSLAWVVKTCEQTNPSGVGHAYYHETVVYIGDMSNGVLTKISPNGGWKVDYTVAEVKAARERYEQANRAADDARSALHPFGEYDH